jgi:hypothetical protein
VRCTDDRILIRIPSFTGVKQRDAMAIGDRKQTLFANQGQTPCGRGQRYHAPQPK